MSRKRTHVECNRCNGTGRVELSACLIATLGVIRRKGEADAVSIWKALKPTNGAKATAFNMRLVRLEAAGLIKHVRSEGRTKFFAAVNPKK